MSALALLARNLGAPIEVRAPTSFATPLDLAEALNPFATVRTPMLELINDAVMDTLTDPDGGRLIISTPPQEGKTSAVTRAVPLWLLMGNPDLRIAVACYSKELAGEFGEWIRDQISHFDGTDGELDLGLRVDRSRKARTFWKIAGRMGLFIAAGMQAGTITGRAVDALIIDDPYGGMGDADSASFRANVWSFWVSKALPRLPGAAPVILIQTRWHEDDLAGRLRAADDGHIWRVINIPAQADHDPDRGETDPLGRAPGQWLESARGRTRAQWEARKLATSVREWTAMYQGRPSPVTGNVWQRGAWVRYTERPWTSDGEVRFAEGFDELIQSWDMAFKDTKGSDYVVGQVWGRRGAQAWLLDQVRDRMTFTETLAAFKRLTARWPQASAKYVEDKANGTAVIDSLRSKIGGIIPISPHESKYARAVSVSPFVEAGNVLLPADELEVLDVAAFVDESAAFPNGAHDDQVDATSQALQQLLLDGAGAAAWIAFVKRRSAALAAEAAAETEPDPDTAALAVLDPLAAARQSAFRASRKGRR
jgi:predicted phage terminase large subunit-like protein